MTRLLLQPVVEQCLSIVPKLSDSRLLIELSGNADIETQPRLDSYLKMIHEEAAHLAVKEIVFDCRQLYFMNSTSLKCFAVWIGTNLQLPSTSRFSVRFVIDSKLRWQERSFHVFRQFGDGTVIVESSLT